MMEDVTIHDIFLTNPIDSLKFVGNFVKVELENKKVVYGTVYTIDPVSQSLVLISRDISEEMSVKIILKHSVNSIEIVPEIPLEQQNILSNDIFSLNQNGSLESHSKEDVLSWLKKNMIPVVESGDKLIIDSLEIHPPYGINQCYSSNSIILSRIQKLLRQMPCKST